MKEAKNRYHSSDSKEKVAEYYINNQEALKENARNGYRNLSEEEKKVKRAYGRDRYRNMTEDEKNGLKGYQKKLPGNKIDEY